MNSDWYNSVRTLDRTGTLSDSAMRTMLSINVRRTQLRFRRNLKKTIVPTGPFISRYGRTATRCIVVPAELRHCEYPETPRCVHVRDDV